MTAVATLTAGLPDEAAGDPQCRLAHHAWCPAFEDPVFDDSNAHLAALHAGGVTIWDGSTGTERRHLSIDIGIAGSNRSVALSPGGDMIAVRNGSHLTVIDSSSGVQLGDLGRVTALSVEFSPDGTSLAAGVEDGVRVWLLDRAN